MLRSFIAFICLGASLMATEAKIVSDPKLPIEWLDEEYFDNIWKMANASCSQADFEGKNDWRTPTVKELKRLANDESFKKEFDSIADGLYWSSDEVDEFSAYAVYIGNGFVSENDKCDKYLFICVRKR